MHLSTYPSSIIYLWPKLTNPFTYFFFSQVRFNSPVPVAEPCAQSEGDERALVRCSGSADGPREEDQRRGGKEIRHKRLQSHPQTGLSLLLKTQLGFSNKMYFRQILEKSTHISYGSHPVSHAISSLSTRRLSPKLRYVVYIQVECFCHSHSFFKISLSL